MAKKNESKTKKVPFKPLNGKRVNPIKTKK